MSNKKLDPKDFVVKAGAKISTIDLDAEEVIFQGKRLTEADAEALADKVLKSGRGRPSLSSHMKRSPQLGIRVSDTTYDRLRERAEHEGKKISEVVREAIEHYV